MKKSVMMAALVGLVGAASGGIQTQAINVDIDSGRGEFGQSLAFDRFDDQGGARRLDAVNVRWQGTMAMEVTAQSFTPQFIAEDTWEAEIGFLAFLSFFGGGDGGDGDGEGLGGPFFSLGGIFIENMTGDLTEGEPGISPFDPGTPGDPITESTSGSINSFLTSNPSSLDFYIGTEGFDGFFGPFTDIVVTPPFGNAFIEVFASELTMLGTLTLEYEYTVVPAPAGAGLLAMGGLVAARRRR